MVCWASLALANQSFFGALAQAPVQAFNRQLQAAAQQDAPWTTDYRQIAQRFVQHPIQRIEAQDFANHLVLSVTTTQHDQDTLYILTLYRDNHIWQLRHAQLGWRCFGQNSYRSSPCD